ncbi:Inositol-pentakisphosphate 2-kinase [Musa troglodytarum]|uniref:Inositol-pentakisphosphate 2-kinase n=1 Tax=Musa troglodytarum TaxID=320322 RepID=A0A9E7KV19_9LILI|nr:Inositol-pentakisphosphate 2-kinase [Musa troglodytarum]
MLVVKSYAEEEVNLKIPSPVGVALLTTRRPSFIRQATEERSSCLPLGEWFPELVIPSLLAPVPLHPRMTSDPAQPKPHTRPFSFFFGLSLHLLQVLLLVHASTFLSYPFFLERYAASIMQLVSGY